MLNYCYSQAKRNESKKPMIFQQIINKMILNPRRLFLIDGVGAVLSAIFLGVVLVRFEKIFGMPKEMLYFLAFLPCIFVIYDIYCYLRIQEYQKPFLKIIAFANLIYCCISIAMVFLHYRELTNLGLVYFILEVLIIVILIIIELKTDAKLMSKARLRNDK